MTREFPQFSLERAEWRGTVRTSIGLILMQVFIAAGGSIAAGLRTLSVSGCSSAHPCDFTLMAVGMYLPFLGGTVAVVASIGALVTGAVRRRQSWTYCLAGLALASVTALLGSALVAVALRM
jgi:hypothetical protein